MPSLPMTLFGAERSRARTDQAAWQTAWQTAFPHLEIVRRAEDAVSGREDQVAVWTLGDMALMRASLSAVAFRRPPVYITADGRDALAFAVLTRGSWAGRAGGSDLAVGLGELVALDPGLPLSVSSSTCECVVVSVPRGAVQDAVSVKPDLHGHVFRGVGGALLTDHILSLARHVGGMQAQEVPAVRGAMLAQIAAAITLIAPEDAVKPGVLRMQHAIKRYIDRHLTDEHLSPDDVARALEISRSSLYRAFQSEGGIEAHIRRRRLQAVHALLRMPGETRSIEQLAHSFGFSRPSHMTTAFRRSFGYSPLRLRTARRTRARSDGIANGSRSEDARAPSRDRPVGSGSQVEPRADDDPGKPGT